MPTPWTVLSSTITYADRWLRVRSDRCQTADGMIIEPYHVLEYPLWVNVVALDQFERIILLREYRHGIGAVLLGLPSGTAEGDEVHAESVMRRELQEETGYTTSSWITTGKTFPNPANHNNLTYSFLALNARQDHVQSWDATEDIEIVTMDFVDFVLEVSTGQAQFQALYTSALFYAVGHILRSNCAELAGLRQRLVRSLLLETDPSSR